MGRRGRIAIGAGTAVVLAGGMVAAGLGWLNGGDGGDAASGEAAPATAEVELRDLTVTEKFAGTLTYGDPKTVTAAVPGTVTWLPDPGTVVTRGKPLYTVDNEPVVLMYGLLPMWRELAPGIGGPDVEQLEENLADLGYTGFTVDDEFTYSTAEAVADWQEDNGLAETGAVPAGQVVFTDGAARVAEHQASVGAPANGAILGYTANVRTVAVDLDVADQELVEDDAAVTVTLPDGAEVDGKIDGIGTTVSAPAAENGAGASGDGTDTIGVTVSIEDQKALGVLDSAPVEVEVTTETREDVLAVPVEALLALREGGYGVQVVDGDTLTLVAVETGLFASGYVEITGDGIGAGVLVGLAA